MKNEMSNNIFLSDGKMADDRKINNALWFGDCLEQMKRIPNKSIDFICCDLPYGMTAPKWDEILPADKLWEQYNRIIADNGTIALFASQPFTTKLISSNEKDYRYVWYWVKNQATNFFHAKRMPLRKVEEVVIFKKGKYYPQMTEGHEPTNSAKGCSDGKAYHGKNKRDYKGGKTKRYPTNLLEFKCVDNYSRVHSSQKPIELIKYLIETYTDIGDTVLDNTCGSDTTGIASFELGRNSISIENDLSIYNLAKKRREEKNIITVDMYEPLNETGT